VDCEDGMYHVPHRTIRLKVAFLGQRILRTIASTFNLNKWHERMIIKGVGMNPGWR
jgi:hypothetical protein